MNVKKQVVDFPWRERNTELRFNVQLKGQTFLREFSVLVVGWGASFRNFSDAPNDRR